MLLELTILYIGSILNKLKENTWYSYRFLESSCLMCTRCWKHFTFYCAFVSEAVRKRSDKTFNSYRASLCNSSWNIRHILITLESAWVEFWCAFVFLTCKSVTLVSRKPLYKGTGHRKSPSWGVYNQGIWSVIKVMIEVDASSQPANGNLTLTAVSFHQWKNRSV